MGSIYEFVKEQRDRYRTDTVSSRRSCGPKLVEYTTFATGKAQERRTNMTF
jgi:hypothetical protein